MRVAVISDIHGNYHALQAVLADIRREGPDATWCLGDLVGYGPRPNDCTAAVKLASRICLVGNHDLGVIGRIPLDDFSRDAAAAARWSQAVLTPETRRFLDSRKTSGKAHHSELFHASPRDPVWEYVLSDTVARAALRLTSAPIVLVGHSHVALAYGVDGETFAGTLAPEGTAIDLASGRWLLNPGSVGQPRDGDPRAAWLLIDFDAETAVYRRVAYAVERTQEEIADRGLPDTLAARLAHGI